MSFLDDICKRLDGAALLSEEDQVYGFVDSGSYALNKVLSGRYGPYVTDGETNASLPKEVTDPSTLTEEVAVNLILERRAKGPSKKKTKKKTKKKAAKKTAKKKTKKKAVKKAAAKKVSKKASSKHAAPRKVSLRNPR